MVCAPFVCAWRRNRRITENGDGRSENPAFEQERVERTENNIYTAVFHSRCDSLKSENLKSEGRVYIPISYHNGVKDVVTATVK